MVTGYWIRLYEKVEIRVNIIGLDEFVRNYCELMNKEKDIIDFNYFLSICPEHSSNIKKLLKLFHLYKNDIIIIKLNKDLISSNFNINSLLGAYVDKKSDKVFLTGYHCGISDKDVKNIITLRL